MNLTVGIASDSINFASVWVAKAEGIFAKNNLNITWLSNTQNTSAALLSSHKADVILYTPVTPLQMSQTGLSTSIIYSNSGNGISPLITKPSIKTLAQLQALSSCTVNTPAPGSSLYAGAVSYIDYFHLKCHLAPLASSTVQVPAVAAGRNDSGVVNCTSASGAVTAGQVNEVLNPLTASDEVKQGLQSNTYPALVSFGLSDNLKAKKTAITAFVKSLIEGNAEATSASADTLGTLLTTKIPSDFPGVNAASATLSWQCAKGVLPTGDKPGFISSAEWSTALQGYTTWGLQSFDPSAPAYAYDKVVDMSYYDAASK